MSTITPTSFFVRLKALSLKRRIALGGVVLLAIVVLSVLLAFIQENTYRVGNEMYSSDGVSSSVQFTNPLSLGGSYGGENGDMAQGLTDTDSVAKRAPAPSGAVGSYDESAYEASSYDVRIRSYAIGTTCNTIESWKSHTYVVFEKTTKHDTACSYYFKVEKAYAPAMLEAIKKLNPDELTANIDVVRKQMMQYDTQSGILLRKQEILKTTLANATQAYDELVALAKDKGDVAVLAKVLDSQLMQIERITNQQLALSVQLDSLARARIELEDGVGFVSFAVSVEKYHMFSMKNVRDSWLGAYYTFVRTVHETIQDLTLGLLANIPVLAKALLYLAILVVIVKYSWQTVRNFWKGKPLSRGTKK